MTCESLRTEYVEALNAWIPLEDQLKEFALSHIGPDAKPIIVGGAEFEEWGQLIERRDAAFDRYMTAQRAYYAGRHPD